MASHFQQSTSSPVWIFVDNSNLWINAKQLAAKKSNMLTEEDHRVRFDIGKLTDVIANDPSGVYGKAGNGKLKRKAETESGKTHNAYTLFRTRN